jgi:hypothetical protein
MSELPTGVGTGAAPTPTGRLEGRVKTRTLDTEGCGTRGNVSEDSALKGRRYTVQKRTRLLAGAAEELWGGQPDELAAWR